MGAGGGSSRFESISKSAEQRAVEKIIEVALAKKIVAWLDMPEQSKLKSALIKTEQKARIARAAHPVGTPSTEKAIRASHCVERHLKKVIPYQQMIDPSPAPLMFSWALNRVVYHYVDGTYNAPWEKEKTS